MIACPGCGANLLFDIASQQMKCSYCESSYDPYQFDSMQKDASREKVYDAWIYACPSCGARLMTTDETDAEAFCPYCGGASILFDRLRKVKYPSWIIPFQVDKDCCRREYSKAARRAFFTPARYKKAEMIDGFRAIYMPFWSYAVEQKGRAKVDVESKTSRDGDYLITDQYTVEGDVDVSYDGWTHDASKAFDDEISECLAPFNTEGRKPFTPGYLSGFYVDVADERANKYADDAKRYFEKLTAEKLLESDEVNRAAKENEAHTIGITGVSIPTKVTKTEQVLYPVWFMSYREGDRITYATVNGQTGKVVADFPISPWRFLAAALLTALAVFAVLSLFFTLKPESTLLLTSLLLIIGVLMCRKQSKQLSERYNDEETARRRAAYVNSQKIAIVLTVVALIVSGVVLLTHPVYNAVFYGVCIAEAIILFVLIRQAFLLQMQLATRKPPQFNKKGGEDHA
jgi:DNA-directed RNA polymerase subunit RPC12/RpoP